MVVEMQLSLSCMRLERVSHTSGRMCSKREVRCSDAMRDGDAMRGGGARVAGVRIVDYVSTHRMVNFPACVNDLTPLNGL